MKRFCSVALVTFMLITFIGSFLIETNALSYSNDKNSWELKGSVLTVKGTGIILFNESDSWRDRVI